MTIHLLQEHSMTSSADVPWISFEGLKTLNKKGCSISPAVELVWKNFAGDPPPQVKIIGAFSQEAESLIETVTINSAGNAAESKIIFVNPAFRMLRLQFIANGAAAGSINAYLHLQY